MTHDYENMEDIDDLSDDELRAVVREHLAEHEGVDPTDLTVRVEAGAVILGGRVGTDGERLIAEHIVTDVVGVQLLRNEIFVDPVRRAVNPEAADENLVDEEGRESRRLTDKAVPLSPETEDRGEEPGTDFFGTTDVHSAIADGTTWIPPESPTQEGFSQAGESGEDH